MGFGKSIVGPVQDKKSNLREVKEFLSILEGIPMRKP